MQQLHKDARPQSGHGYKVVPVRQIIFVARGQAGPRTGDQGWTGWAIVGGLRQ